MLQLGYNVIQGVSRCAFLVVCAGLLALLTIGNTANAQFAYTSVDSDSSFSNSAFSVDMDHDGINEFQITHSDAEYVNIRIIPGNNPNDYLSGIWVGNAFGNYARVVEAGEMIDENQYFVGGSRWLIRDSNGFWYGMYDKYIGLAVVIDGYMRYGWIQVDVAKDGNRMRVVDYAFNLAKDAPIEAGTGATLPVELETFAALQDDGMVDLRWQTLSETANAGFELQHQYEGPFEPVAFIEGNGTSTAAHSYAYRMSDLEPGVHSFRLKQIDVGGNYSYSETIEVAIDVPGEYVLGNAYPNPFNPEASFSLAIQKTQQVDVSVYNTLGQRVATLFAGTLEGGATHSFTIDGSQLSSGLYLYRVEGESFSATKTVSLLK